MSKFVGLSLVVCTILAFGSETPYSAKTKVEPVLLSKPTTDNVSTSAESTIYVKKIAISGNVRVATSVLQKTIEEDEERTYTYKKLEELLSKINKKYKSLGFGKARAVILEQEIKDFTLNIYITTDQELATNPIKIIFPPQQKDDTTVQKGNDRQPDPKESMVKSSADNNVSGENPIAVIAAPKDEIQPLPISKIEPHTLKTEPITIRSLLNEQIPQKQNIDVVPHDALPATTLEKPLTKQTYTNYKIEKPVVPHDQPRAEASKPIKENILDESATENITPSDKNEESSFSVKNVLLFATNALLLVLSIGFVF